MSFPTHDTLKAAMLALASPKHWSQPAPTRLLHSSGVEVELIPRNDVAPIILPNLCAWERHLLQAGGVNTPHKTPIKMRAYDLVVGVAAHTFMACPEHGVTLVSVPDPVAVPLGSVWLANTGYTLDLRAILQASFGQRAYQRHAAGMAVVLQTLLPTLKNNHSWLYIHESLSIRSLGSCESIETLSNSKGFVEALIDAGLFQPRVLPLHPGPTMPRNGMRLMAPNDCLFLHKPTSGHKQLRVLRYWQAQAQGWSSDRSYPVSLST